MSFADDLAAWGGVRALVVGDVMLDRFVYGRVERISPEAPIPVLRQREERLMLGGAGNVASNLRAMGGSVRLMGLKGDDAAGAAIEGLARRCGIVPDVLTGRAPTTQKTRFVAQGQQLLRLDQEEGSQEPADARALAAAAAKALSEADVLVLSDYGKGALADGVLATLLDRARVLGVPVVVDPKRTDLAAYAGASIITPNAAETRAATGIDPITDADAEAAGRVVRRMAGARAALVTRGARGMTLVDEAGAHHFRSAAREVFDVSGAGDTVVAAIALALGARRDLLAGTRLANVAAGLVVARSGTATVDRAAIAEAVAGEAGSGRTRIAGNWDEAAAIVDAWRSRGFKVGFTNGCFDLLHAGHVHLLDQARAACDRLVVGLNADGSVRRLKGATRPLQPGRDRARVLAAIGSVDLVVLFEEDTPRSLVTTLRPDVLVKGADYAGRFVAGREEVEAWGGTVVLAELVPGLSTTALARRMAEADPAERLAPAHEL